MWVVIATDGEREVLAVFGPFKNRAECNEWKQSHGTISQEYEEHMLVRPSW